MTNNYPPIVHVGAAVIRRGDQFLITQRADNQLWEFPGGKSEPGEDIRATVAREIREELGLSIVVHDHMATVFYDHQWALPPEKTGRMPGNYKDALVHLFYCAVNWHETPDYVFDARSVMDYAWTMTFDAYITAANPANRRAFSIAKSQRQ